MTKPAAVPASTEEYRALRARQMSENELLAGVRRLARAGGWLCYHTHRSDRSEPGWPDVVLVRCGVLLVRELKTERGRLSPAQEQWLVHLVDAGIDASVWRPADLLDRTIERALIGGRS